MKYSEQIDVAEDNVPSPAEIEAHVRRAHKMRSLYVAKQFSALASAIGRSFKGPKAAPSVRKLSKVA